MSQSIAMKLRSAILEGRLKPGARLPTERQLAIELAVGRNVVREAVGRMISEGLLIIRRGSGTLVRDWKRDGMFDLLLYLVWLKDKTPQGSELVQQLLWLRRTLYTSLAPLIPTDSETVEGIDGAAWNIRARTPAGYNWRTVEHTLNGEESFLCELAAKTGNLPATLLAHTLRRCLMLLAQSAPRLQEIEPALDRFKQLAKPLAEKDAAATAAMLDALCRLREDVYLGLAAPPAEAEQSPSAPPVS